MNMSCLAVGRIVVWRCLVILLVSLCFRASAYQVYLFNGSMNRDGSAIMMRSDIAYCWDHIDGIYIHPEALWQLYAYGFSSAQQQNFVNRIALLKQTRGLPYILERRPYSTTVPGSGLDDWFEFNQYDTEFSSWHNAGFSAPWLHFSYHHGAALHGIPLPPGWTATLSPDEMETLEDNVNFIDTGSAWKQAAFTRGNTLAYRTALNDGHSVAGFCEFAGFNEYTGDLSYFDSLCDGLGDTINAAFDRSMKMVVMMPNQVGFGGLAEDLPYTLLVDRLMDRLESKIGLARLRSSNLSFHAADYTHKNFFPEYDPHTVSGLTRYLLQNRDYFQGYISTPVVSWAEDFDGFSAGYDIDDSSEWVQVAGIGSFLVSNAGNPYKRLSTPMGADEKIIIEPITQYVGDDFFFIADVKIPVDSKWAGLVANFQGNNNYMEFGINDGVGVNGAYTVRIRRVVNGVETWIDWASNTEVPINRTVWYRMRVVYSADTETYVYSILNENNVAVYRCEFADSTFDRGSFGIFGTGAGGHVFDNIAVSKP